MPPRNKTVAQKGHSDGQMAFAGKESVRVYGTAKDTVA